MAAEGVAARVAAVAILDAILGERMILAEVLAFPNGPLHGLSPSDRGRAQRLALTTLRHMEQADRVLAPHLRRAPPRTVANVLRLGVVELAVEGAAAHGVVNACVDIVRRGRKTGHMAGLVNAVLRKLSAETDLFAAMPPQRMPMWLRQPLVHAWGRPAVTAMEAVQAQIPPLDLTLKPGASPIEGAIPLPTGSWRLNGAGQVSALPGYASGDWWVQDAAAALPARLLDAQPGERVLDLCAAPGGKTLQLAAAGADVTALDISPQRLKRLIENLTRCGLKAQVVTADALEWQPAELFDAVLLDAPCSATGTVRRHPDLPFAKDGSEISNLIDLQSRLIDRALGFLKPGGRLVFCTCSLLPDEGEVQLASALSRHPGLKLEEPALAGVPEDWRAVGGGLRTRPDYWPERGGIDGFFMARLRRS
ncbi:MAG: 16S rRNA methyltransferase [Cereibacter sphaeroides]|uniref:16S rRNA methyltransferase n=1 Tax=Cereibacter sphaeroides TaxID=1063 RepID=A0A2W5SA63_CERSP|nr:MAG: 16S rRNA methyltransferase [Cereibacter sphaeroides]